MSALRVVSWNVLHRVHALNWNEHPAETFPDERARVAGITQRIVELVEEGVDAIGLQEVSGDQLASLRGALPGVTVLEHRYPRLPRLRSGAPSGLADAAEYLVTIAARPGAQKRESRTFDSDPGKGLLVTELADGTCFIDTHVSYGPRGPAQLAVLLATVERIASMKTAVIVGDFNAPSSALRSAFGASFALSDLTGQEPTRSATSEHQGRTIDHVAARNADLVSATVLDGHALSDHAPVAAELRARS